MLLYRGQLHNIHLWLYRTVSHLLPYISRATVIDSCLNNCKYYDCRWQKNEDNDSVCRISRGTLGCRDICEVCFGTKCKKNAISNIPSYGDCRGWLEDKTLVEVRALEIVDTPLVLEFYFIWGNLMTLANHWDL